MKTISAPLPMGHENERTSYEYDEYKRIIKVTTPCATHVANTMRASNTSYAP
jgi:hypothetical protein